MKPKTYKNFIEFLDGLKEQRVKLGLKGMLDACNRLGHPERGFKSIHIAGTNGKGSTAAFLERLIRSSGYKVGLFTSPHLVDVRERIQINRKLIKPDEVLTLFRIIREKCSEISLSYFEFLTVVAFLHFSVQKVDFAVIETGIGGRLDATNIIEPALTIITPIAIDHTSLLGGDILSIAREKCGIITRGVPVVVGRQAPTVLRLIRRVCRERGAPFVRSGKVVDERDLSLKGHYQVENASLALKAAVTLKKAGHRIKIDKKALKSVLWPGRLEKVSSRPEIILDGAHNPHASKALATHLIKDYYRKRDIIFVFSAMKDKDIKGMVKRLKVVAAGWVLVPLKGERAASVRTLRKAVGDGLGVLSASGVSDAVGKALSLGFKNPLIVATGSLYLVGKFLECYHGKGAKDTLSG